MVERTAAPGGMASPPVTSFKIYRLRTMPARASSRSVHPQHLMGRPTVSINIPRLMQPTSPMTIMAILTTTGLTPSPTMSRTGSQRSAVGQSPQPTFTTRQDVGFKRLPTVSVLILSMPELMRSPNMMVWAAAVLSSGAMSMGRVSMSRS